MDLSKLPKLGGTSEESKIPHEAGQSLADPTEPAATPAQTLPPQDQHPQQYPPQYQQPNQVPPGYGYGPSSLAAEIWVSVIFGLIFLMLGSRFGGYGMSVLTNKTYHTGIPWIAGPKAGQEVTYPELTGKPIWSESGFFVLGLAMILDALATVAVLKNLKFAKPMTRISLGIILLAVILNVIAVYVIFQTGLMPLISLLALAVGGFSLFSRWGQIQTQGKC